MGLRKEVHSAKLNAEITSKGIELTYLDGRTVIYSREPEKVEKHIKCQPGKDIHLIIIENNTGKIMYIDELKTDHTILESTGVGKYLIPLKETIEVYAGVLARKEGHSIEIIADFDRVNGRIFVFQEDEFGERAHEII